MGFWDRLKTAWVGARQAAEGAATEAALSEVARRSAAAAERVADEAIADAEQVLEREQQARAGRPDVRPDRSEADRIAASIEALVDDATKR